MGIQHKNVKKPGGNLHCIMAFQKRTWQHHRKTTPTASSKRMLQGEEEEDEIQTDGSNTDEHNYIASDTSD